MSQGSIAYTDKQDSIVNPALAINKVVAADMNSIKSVVNLNSTDSETRLSAIEVMNTTETITSTDTLVITDSVILVDATSGDVTVNLPAASTMTKKEYTIKKIDSSVNTAIIDANSSETIDGSTTAVITSQYASITIVCDGTEWWIK